MESSILIKQLDFVELACIIVIYHLQSVIEPSKKSIVVCLSDFCGLLWGDILKTLLLVTKRRAIQDMYRAELNKVFGRHLNIIPCVHPDDGEDFSADSGIAQADVVLITNPYSFPRARRQMRQDAAIINLNFAFAKERVEALKAYPVGTEALACFNYYSSAHQTVNALYAAGVTNLNLYVHYPGNRNLTDKRIDLAIISGQTDSIPEGIPHVFDLGERKLSLTTLLDIAVKANILDDALQKSIVRYCDTISTSNDYLSYFYNNSAASTIQLKAIMECIDYGIVIYDQDGSIINFNQNFVRLFGLAPDLYGRKLGSLSLEGELGRLLLTGEECRNRLCHLKSLGRSFTVSKEKINKGDRRRDLFILLIKDITELTNLETSLRRQIAKRGHVAKYTFADIKGSSPAMEQCLGKARRIAQIDKPTLIIGESGTGKELFAQSIHNASGRARFPFVAMNCAAIPSTLLESELFGYDEGAFTGARKGGKEGLFQMAQKGTLFLDEIGELSLPTQAKLLRVLEEKEIMKVGSGELIGVDVRIIAATNRNLNALVDSGEFRLDLYYRLNTLIINVPPLRARHSDISTLIRVFLRQEGLDKADFDPAVWDFLMGYEWKGNIRELRNCVEYMANIADGRMTAEHLPDYIRETYESSRSSRALLRGRAEELTQSDREAVVNVLALLKKKPLGRRSILQALGEEDIYMTEYRLRGILAYLSQNGAIVFGRGRAGCSISRSGEELLNALLSLGG